MKPISVTVLTIYLSLFLSNSNAADPVAEKEILAKRGKGVVTQQSFTARADMIPTMYRRSSLRDRNRLRDVINTLLLRSQLAQEAREAGFDKEEIVIGRMMLAAEAELSKAWVEHYVELQSAGDYEAMAREYYQLHQEKLLSSEQVSVTHILISTDERSDDEAKALVDSISLQLQEEPAAFDELVLKYSEDPSASANKGKFVNMKRGEMVEPFEKAAFALSDGEISEPVRTGYGYHIIRLDDHPARQKLKFDDIKPALVKDARKEHEDRIRADYLSTLTSLDVEMTEAALEELVKRLYGENYSEQALDSLK